MIENDKKEIPCDRCEKKLKLLEDPFFYCECQMKPINIRRLSPHKAICVDCINKGKLMHQLYYRGELNNKDQPDGRGVVILPGYFVLASNFKDSIVTGEFFLLDMMG